MRLPRPRLARPFGGRRQDGRLLDARSVIVDVPRNQAFHPIRTIGGPNGWYAGDVVWRARGALDAVLGGPGHRRLRRDPDDLRVGDPIDSWRVEAYEPEAVLLLRAEMRLPGRAWLRYDVEPAPSGTRITQTAIFEPKGRLGRAYWYGIWPLHDLVFARMLQALGDRALGPNRPAPPH